MPGRSRPLVALLVVALAVTAGCSDRPRSEPASGSITVTVTNGDDVAHSASLTILENGTVTGEMSADAVPPGNTVRFASNETGGPFTVRVAAGSVGRSFEWSPADCAHRVVNVSVGSDGQFETSDDCRSE